MAGFVYFRSGQRPVSKMEHVERMGLAYAFDKPPAVNLTTSGPDGTQGYTFARSAKDVGYSATEQKWRQIPGSDAWVGVREDCLPGPLDLARPNLISGHDVKLDDGNFWHIPCARRYTLNGGPDPGIQINLPARFAYDSEGRWTVSGVKRQYKELWDLTCGYEEALVAAVDQLGDEHDGDIVFEFENLDRLAVTAIRTNYYIAEAELDLLEIYDQQAREAIISAVRDQPTWQKWLAQKKMAEQARAGGTS